MIRHFTKLLAILALTIAAGCAGPPTGGYPLASQNDIAALASAIKALGNNIDPAEAERAAQIAMLYPNQLAKEYGITDHPLIHNTKVNRGRRPRGLCWHWAQDLETRLAQENFKTLTLHRAIANSNSAILIEHSTVIISQIGDGQDQGIVLDAWRNGGALYWAPTLKDKKYTWIARAKVFETKRARILQKQRYANNRQ